TAFAGFDADGWNHLVITDGQTDSNLREMGRDSQFQQPPQLYHNQQGRLVPVGDAAGDYFSHEHVGRCLIICDLDNDRDPDLVITHRDAAPAVLLNQSPQQCADLTTLRMVGTTANRDGTGAAIHVAGATPPLSYCISSGGGYLGASLGRTLVCQEQVGEQVLELSWPLIGQSGELQLPRPGDYVFIQGRSVPLLILPE
ncbi:MAG: hypothetical protein KDA85_04430, partial [Planctomycetaceae bacterium]|nr:hypothetical protein [Planctomycetaceae bacterium]